MYHPVSTRIQNLWTCSKHTSKERRAQYLVPVVVEPIIEPITENIQTPLVNDVAASLIENIYTSSAQSIKQIDDLTVGKWESSHIVDHTTEELIEELNDILNKLKDRSVDLSNVLSTYTRQTHTPIS